MCFTLAASGACDDSLEFGRPSGEEISASASSLSESARLESLLSTALDVYYDGRYDSARSILTRVEADAAASGDVASQARALTWLSLAAWRQGRYPEAKALGETALAVKLDAGLRDQLSRSYNALGLVAWDESRFEDAAALFQQAADAADEVGDTAGAARAAGNLALVATEWGEFAQAREGYAAMLRAGRALDDGVMAGNALTNLGALEIMVGRPLHAVPLLQEAIGLYRKIDYPTGLENALGQLGSSYAVLGNLGGAHVMYDSALAIARAQGLRQQEANDLAVLAELYVAADNRVRALELHGEAEDIYAELGLETELGRSLRTQAEIFAELGNNDRALALARGALETHRRVGARFEELEGLVVLSELEEAAGGTGRADSLLAEATELAAALGTRSAASSVSLAAARISDQRADAEGVIAAIEGGGALLFQGDYETEWEAQALRARAFLRLGEVDSALVAGRRAVSTVERVRGSFRSKAMRTGFSAARQKTYADLMAALLLAGLTSEAFVVADKARGQALREHVGLRGGPGGAEAAGEASRAEELLRRIGQLVATLDAIQTEGGAGVDTAASRLWARLARARSDYEALQVSLAESALATVSVREPERLELDVRSALEPGEILLEYFVMPDRVAAFIITRDTTIVLTSETASTDLESRVRLARKLVGSPEGNPAEATPVLEALHETLIAPAARHVRLSEAELLILVPHGVLTYLPFAALLQPESGERLVETLPLLHLPSATSLAELRSRGPGGSDAAFAEEMTYVLAPFPEELPATDEEARAVMPLRREALFYRGATATEERLRSVLESGGLVHFASHAVMNARNPLFSRLELARGHADRTDDDGRLEIHEILDLQVKTPLLYLSGCDTGLGPATATRFDSGEDYSTLAQSFLYVGAQNVLATLWRVEDRSAALLASHFYEELRNVPPPQALARAQLKLLSHPKFGDPFFWAGYRLNGSGR